MVSLYKESFVQFKLQKKILATLICALPIFSVNAESNGLGENSIKFEGLDHLSSSNVLQTIGYTPGDWGDSDTNKIITELYSTGYFDDIKIFKSDRGLLIKVKERPIISSIEIQGNDSVKSKDLKKGFNSAGLTVGNVYNPELIQQIKYSLKQEYYNLSKYSANINVVAKVEPRNRVRILFNISEGKTAKVKQINIIGNQKYSNKLLMETVSMTTPSWINLWGLLTSNDKYSPSLMEKSTEDLRSFYMNHGYMDFSVDSSQASLTSDKEHTYVAFNITEGGIYRVSDLNLQLSETSYSKEIFNSLISIHKGDIFNRKKLMETVSAVKAFLGKEGYAFASVNPVPNINRENKTVKIAIYINPGKKVYIHHINFKGNNITNDNVYRREMLYSEGSPYNEYMINQSKLRLQRLPYIQNVEVQAVPVKGTNDMVNLNYYIKERSANSVTASLGYSQLYKFMIGGSLNMPNVIGTGNIMNFSTQLSKSYKSLSASYTNPYFTDTGISQTLGAYITDVDTSGTTLTSYSTDSYGMTLGYGVPLSINDTLNVGAGYDHTKLVGGTGEGSSMTVQKFIKDNGDSFNSYLVNAGITHNTSNRAYFPNAGYIVNVGAQIAVPGSDLTWYKAHVKTSWYHALSSYATLSLKSGVQYGNGYGDNSTLPFYQNYYGGGWGSVRGYNMGGMGPVDSLQPSSSNSQYTEGSPLGGNLNVYANFDLLFPIPGVGDSSNMRWGTFFDFGNTYSTYNTNIYGDSSKYDSTNPSAWPSQWSKTPRYPTFSNLRYSVGLEFQWASPMGPLAFSIAKPLNAKPEDDTQFFQFSLGQSF